MSLETDHSKYRKEKMKELILKLHSEESEDAVREQLLKSVSSILYGEVVEVQQELVSEGLPEEEVLRFGSCHSAVLEGRVDLSGKKEIPPCHPVDVMNQDVQ